MATGKPYPDGYRLALKQSGLASDCVVALEDSAAGLKAASAAGLSCVLTPSPWDQDLVGAIHLAAAVFDHLGDEHNPSLLQQGPPCLEGMLTLNYMKSLLLHSGS